jgi:hypothetical protein
VHSSRAGVRRSPIHSAEEWCAQQQSRSEEEPCTLSRGVPGLLRESTRPNGGRTHLHHGDAGKSRGWARHAVLLPRVWLHVLAPQASQG